MKSVLYIIRKIVSLILTLLLVSVIAFFVYEIIPGDSVTAMLGTEYTEERAEALREELGYNKPIYERYLIWLENFVTGDMGESVNYKMPVADIIADKLPVTLWLGLISMLQIIIISIPLGVWFAWREHKGKGIFIEYFNQFVMSIPSFFLGIIIIYIFGNILKLFTPGQYVDYKENIVGFILYLIPATVTVAISKISMVAKFTRNSMVEQLQADYVRTARSKGASELRIFLHHILRNGLTPVITFLGMVVAEVMAGSIIVEQVFNIPGLGRTLVVAVGNRDLPIVQAIIVYMAALVIIVNFFVDIVYKFIDPRITIGMGRE
ncbi:MAG: ABC transporter permease [Lachnospiraceae bacterium]|nr:ABC transporter permease [Lachnospiraceae bacterium]